MKDQLLEKLKEIIDQLSDPDSDLMEDAEKLLDNEDLTTFAEFLSEAESALVKAEKLIKDNSKDIIDTDGVDVTEEDIDDLGALAQSLDDTNDPNLRRTASVLTEILMTIGANPKDKMSFKKAEEAEIERLRAKHRETRGDREYKDVKAKQDEENKTEEAVKAVNERIKQYRPLEAALSTRYSPDMPGVSLIRIGDNVYQCPVTKKIFDYRSGYTTAKGNKVPGTDVSNQTQHLSDRAPEHMNFGTREQILNNE